ncbi:MAG: trypsin-like peptidase domain-containing protein [Methanocellales archaeon]|nr:trypsin-like peptidase domain-containing protein [Methanocellales archaeon]MDD3291908.1 trypsin-like peptidase domain-containing protein [Methanocellales archaeon]MDD5235781.1 trypsin-like peptidase domain-containing protein [Methanocellales archaeon]MDD5485538.1 trypsin-like peptidase domain-containing protein [Methanocellales archaeon]
MGKKIQVAVLIILILVLAGCIQETVTDVPTPKVSVEPSPPSVTEEDIEELRTEIAELKAVVESQGKRITELEEKELQKDLPALQVKSDPMMLSLAISDIVQRVQPAVVFISVEIETQDFYGRRTTQYGSGSGVIITKDGYILTNNHVVEDATKIEVTLPDFSSPFAARLIGTDPTTDLAVIKIEGDFPTAEFGDASQLRPGNLVIAIGNPLGLEGGPTTTLGVVSNTERSTVVDGTTYYDLIQTDAAINPGNSGGPLLSLDGKVIGINTLSGGAENIGFAISANTAKPVYDALITPPHKVIRPWLGVGFRTVTPDLAAQEGYQRTTGVVILSVQKGSPADQAGLMVDDIILSFDGEEVTVDTRLIKMLWSHKVGEEIKLTLLRGGEEKTVIVRLGERPEGL